MNVIGHCGESLKFLTNFFSKLAFLEKSLNIVHRFCGEAYFKTKKITLFA